jgi:hypothetical protein
VPVPSPDKARRFGNTKQVLKELYTRPRLTDGFFMARELYVNVRRGLIQGRVLEEEEEEEEEEEKKKKKKKKKRRRRRRRRRRRIILALIFIKERISQ